VRRGNSPFTLLVGFLLFPLLARGRSGPAPQVRVCSWAVVWERGRALLASWTHPCSFWIVHRWGREKVQSCGPLRLFLFKKVILGYTFWWIHPCDTQLLPTTSGPASPEQKHVNSRLGLELAVGCPREAGFQELNSTRRVVMRHSQPLLVPSVSYSFKYTSTHYSKLSWLKIYERRDHMYFLSLSRFPFSGKYVFFII
jgi:hypothetical protein